MREWVNWAIGQLVIGLLAIGQPVKMVAKKC
jgi:hypothetical protein